MNRRRCISTLFVFVLLGMVLCQTPASAQTQAEELAAVRAAMGNETLPAAEKLALVTKFLEKYPPDRSNSYLVSFAARLLATDLGKPEDALALIRRELGRTVDDNALMNLRSTYIYQCGQNGDLASLRAFEAELRKAGAYDNIIASTFASATLAAKDYAAALAHFDAALEGATPEAVAARFNATPDNARVREWLAWFRGRLLTDKASCLVHLDRPAEALPLLQEAVERGNRNILGLVNGEAMHYFAAALVKLGRVDDALPYLALDGIIGGNKQSLALLQDVYRGKHGALDGFEAYLENERRRLAKPMADFTLPRETGQSFTLGSLKGSVILLDFWFPT